MIQRTAVVIVEGVSRTHAVTLADQLRVGNAVISLRGAAKS